MAQPTTGVAKVPTNNKAFVFPLLSSSPRPIGSVRGPAPLQWRRDAEPSPPNLVSATTNLPPPRRIDTMPPAQTSRSSRKGRAVERNDLNRILLRDPSAGSSSSEEEEGGARSTLQRTHALRSSQQLQRDAVRTATAPMSFDTTSHLTVPQQNSSPGSASAPTHTLPSPAAAPDIDRSTLSVSAPATALAISAAPTHSSTATTRVPAVTSARLRAALKRIFEPTDSPANARMSDVHPSLFSSYSDGEEDFQEHPMYFLLRKRTPDASANSSAAILRKQCPPSANSSNALYTRAKAAEAAVEAAERQLNVAAAAGIVQNQRQQQQPQAAQQPAVLGAHLPIVANNIAVFAPSERLIASAANNTSSSSSLPERSVRTSDDGTSEDERTVLCKGWRAALYAPASAAVAVPLARRSSRRWASAAGARGSRVWQQAKEQLQSAKAAQHTLRYPAEQHEQHTAGWSQSSRPTLSPGLALFESEVSQDDLPPGIIDTSLSLPMRHSRGDCCSSGASSSSHTIGVGYGSNGGYTSDDEVHQQLKEEQRSFAFYDEDLGY